MPNQVIHPWHFLFEKCVFLSETFGNSAASCPPPRTPAVDHETVMSTEDLWEPCQTNPPQGATQTWTQTWSWRMRKRRRRRRRRWQWRSMAGMTGKTCWMVSASRERQRLLPFPPLKFLLRQLGVCSWISQWQWTHMLFPRKWIVPLHKLHCGAGGTFSPHLVFGHVHM